MSKIGKNTGNKSAPAGTEESESAVKPLTQTLLQEFQNLKDNLNKFKNEDDAQDKESPYQHLEKATVLQESRVFHDAAIVTQNPRKCCTLITKLLFLLIKGDTFTSSEITEVFFGVTKLFQSDDVNLRRMMYLFIKEVAETCNPDDVIIVTSSLTKDMNTGEDLYRANSMRVLAKIIDSTMLGAIERYLKQAIVDRNAFVASSALMAGLTLFTSCPEIVRRWINEVQEAVNSSSDMVQYHALSLLYKIKQHDRLAVSKIVQQLSKGSLRSPLATCLLIRYTSSLMSEDTSPTVAKNGYTFLESCLRHKNDMVIYEAAKAICNLPSVEVSDLFPAITVLQLFLSSSKPALRFAAMRTLSDIAVKKPISVARCNDDMESLVADSNRSIATLAITTLLKTGNENSVDRLMKQISTFMTEISDEFKIVVVKAILELCVKYPAKHRVMVNFLATFLREEGGYEFKKSIVDSMVEMMSVIPETKETSLLHLCEFIEDCEFSELIVQVLHLIGSVGPATISPSRYIRFVFNRVILENAVVRAAAVTTLGAFAARVSELRPSIMILLKRSLTDEDDEVRDRTAFILASFGELDGFVMPDYKEEDHIKDGKYLTLDEPLQMSFTAMERSMKAFMEYPNALSDNAKQLTFANLPVIEESYVPTSLPAVRSGAAKKKVAAAAALSSENDGSSAPVAEPSSIIYRIPELALLGRAFHASKEVPLTETEMEYVVTCVKHVFENHVVLQFTVLNTIDDQRLKSLTVNVNFAETDIYSVETVIPAPLVRYGEQANTFVSLLRIGDPTAATLDCEMSFRVIQVDPNTGECEGDEDGYEEEYPLESLEINNSDFMSKSLVGDFRRAWDEMGNEGEVLEKFALQFKKLEDAVQAVLDFLGMLAVDGTGVVPPVTSSDGAKRTHTLHLSGKFVGDVDVLARAQLQSDENAGTVILKLGVRSRDKKISQLVSECIH